MHKGRLIRIILIILILGMGGFILVKNNSLKKQLKNGEIEEITAKDFLPFGSGNGDSVINKIIDAVTPGEQDTEKENLKKTTLVAENIAGATLVTRPDEITGPIGKDSNGNDIFGNITAVRYVLRENGYVYDYIPKYKKSYLISDTEIPKISFAHFSPDGNQILFQYLDSDLSTEKSVLGKLGEGSVIIMPDNLISFSFSQNGDFAYFKNVTSGSILIVRSPNGKEVAVYDSPLTEWNVAYLGENLLITTKASELSNGFSYIVNPKDKTVTKLWSNIKGLTTKASLDGKYILRSASSKSGPELSIYDTFSKTLKSINKLGLTEKCNFTQDGFGFVCGLPKEFVNKYYPDAWYSGEVSTNDIVVKYTTENLNERIISSINSSIQDNLNTWEISSTNTGDDIIITNRNDMSLWIYEE